MSMQISVDPAALSQEQREAVAGFILAYPSKACAGTCHDHAVAEIPAFIHKDTADAGLIELGKLQHDHESTMPAAAFGTAEADFDATVAGSPVSAFGAPTAPLALSTPPAAAGSIVAPPPPANTAPITTTPGVVSSAAPASSGAHDPTAALAALANQNYLGMRREALPRPAAGVELDKSGLPWDNRIHAESKGKIADGTWRKKRNLDPTLLATVEAELSQVMGAAPAAPFAPPVAVVVPPPPVDVKPSIATPASLPSGTPAGEVPADARAQFVALVGRASAAIRGQKVTQAEVNQCCADAGVPALPLLANRLDLVAQVAAHIDALIAARQ